MRYVILAAKLLRNGLFVATVLHYILSATNGNLVSYVIGLIVLIIVLVVADLKY